MKITIHEEKNSHFTFHGEKKGPITSHENTLYHPHTRGKFLKKLWCCIGGEYYEIIWFY